MRVLPALRRRVVAASGIGLVAATLAACSNPFAADVFDDAPRLEPAWTSPVDGWHVYETPWVADEDVWVVRSYDAGALKGVSLADGEVLWTFPIGEVCAFSEINDAGLLAVRSGDGCTDLSLLDTRTGHERWSVEVPKRPAAPPGARHDEIAVTENTVALSSACGFERWSVADAAVLRELTDRRVGEQRPRSRGDRSAVPAACDDVTTAVRGDLAVVAGPSGLIGYDVDTGARRWRRTGDSARIARIYSADPWVVDVALDGLRSLRTLDAGSGDLGEPLGRPLPSIGAGPGIAAPLGEGVIGAYEEPVGDFGADYRSVLRGWDADSGAELFARVSTGDEYLGTDADGIHLGRAVEVPEGHGDDSGAGYWVMRLHETSDAEPRTVGWVPEQLLDVIRVGDLLISQRTWSADDRPTVAYRLPEDDVALTVPEPRRSDDTAWAEGDLRQDPLVDPCAAVSAETLRLAGFDAIADRPAPLDCTWTDGTRKLSVDIDVAIPHDDATAEQSAAESFRTWAAGSPQPTPIFGDEMWQASTQTFGAGRWEEFPGLTTTDASVGVRQRNVIVRASLVDLPWAGTGLDQTQLPIAGTRVQQVLADVVRETLATWGDAGDPGPIAAPEDGPVTTVAAPCARLAAQVETFLPGVEGRDLSAPDERRLRGCRWSTGRYGSFVQVTATAIGPNVLTGTDALEQARAAFAAEDSSSYLTTSVRGPWDEGLLTERDASGYSASARLVVRAENVVLVVQVYREAELYGDSRGAAVRLARAFLSGR